MIYLDYAATTPLNSEAFEEMLPYFTGKFGNPDSLHTFGREAAYAVTKARDTVAQILGVKSGEVYFTSGGTESDNWAVRCLGKGKVLLSPIEHAAALSGSALREGGRRFTAVGENGIVSPESVESALNADTGLVCVMSVNNETGCIQPVKEIAALCKKRGVVFFSDCVQAAASQDLKELCSYADAVSLSGHKFGGPKGVGALVVKKDEALKPLLAGGEQERSLRGGTLNVAGIVGFAVALEFAQKNRKLYCEHTGHLRDLFEEKIFAALGESVKRDGESRAPNISHLTFEMGGEAFLNLLDLNGLAASGGAACSAHAALPSHVMTAMGRNEETAKRGVRFSFGLGTREEEVLRAAEIVIRCAKK